MLPDLKQQIASGLNDYAKANALSGNDISRLTGVNSGYISNILRGQFTNAVGGKDVAIGDKHFYKLAEFCGLATKKSFWHLEPTRQFTEIITTLEECKESCKTALIIAETGLGKTNAIDTFCKKNPQHTFRITVNSLYRLPDLINELAEKVGAEAAALTGRQVKDTSLKIRMDKITNRLIEIKHAGGEPIVIIDEGENMEITLLKMTKGLFDIIKGNCAIVMVGTPKLLRNLTNPNGRNRNSLPELYRRFKAGLKHVAPLDKRKDFAPFFDRYVKDKGLQRLLMLLCENYGELYDYLQPSLKECDERNIELTEHFFRLKWNEQRFQNN